MYLLTLHLLYCIQPFIYTINNNHNNNDNDHNNNHDNNHNHNENEDENEIVTQTFYE